MASGGSTALMLATDARNSGHDTTFSIASRSTSRPMFSPHVSASSSTATAAARRLASLLIRG